MLADDPNIVLDKMLKLKYDPVFGAEYSFADSYRYTPDYRNRRPIEFYFNWPWRYRYWFTNQRFRRNLYKALRVSILPCVMAFK